MKEKKETKEYSHEWYHENGYDEHYEPPQAQYNAGDKTRAGVIEYVNAIRSHDGTLYHYVYIVGDRTYSETDSLKMEASKQYTNETKRYVWELLKGMGDGDEFAVADALIPAHDFIAICKVVMDGRHLWPSDVSFNEDYTKIRKTGHPY